MKIDELILKLEQEIADNNRMRDNVELHSVKYYYKGRLDAISWVKDLLKNLDVATVNRSELIDFANEMQEIGLNEMDDVEKVVDVYLKSVNAT